MAAADIIRKKIRDKLTVGLQLITIAHGYYTDAGLNVTVQKTNPYGSNKLDGIDIRDEKEDHTLLAEEDPLVERTLHLTLAVALKQTDPDKVYEAIADVEKVINGLLLDTTFTDLVDRVIPEGNDNEVSQDENILRGVNIRIGIVYTTDAFDME
jgi:hypothetical protein